MIVGAMNAIEDLVETRILAARNTRSELFRAAVAWLLINLEDLCACAEYDGIELKVEEPVAPAGTIRKLVRICRDAACHIDSGHHGLENSIIQWCVALGKTPSYIEKGTPGTTDYEDDIALWFGGTRLYLSRHAAMLFESIRDAYAERKILTSRGEAAAIERRVQEVRGAFAREDRA